MKAAVRKKKILQKAPLAVRASTSYCKQVTQVKINSRELGVKKILITYVHLTAITLKHLHGKASFCQGHLLFRESFSASTKIAKKQNEDKK